MDETTKQTKKYETKEWVGHRTYHLHSKETVNLIEELTTLLNESPTYVIDLAIQDLYQKTLSEGPQ